MDLEASFTYGMDQALSASSLIERIATECSQLNLPNMKIIVMTRTRDDITLGLEADGQEYKLAKISIVRHEHTISIEPVAYILVQKQVYPIDGPQSMKQIGEAMFRNIGRAVAMFLWSYPKSKSAN